MKSGFFGVVATCLLIGVVGCEWDSSSEGNTWNDAYSWVNFSGVYRGVNGPLIKDFTPGGPITTPTPKPDPDPDPDSEGTPIVVNNENGGTAAGFQTIITGALINRPGIVDGSVTIVFEPTVASGSSGSFTDSGGVLTGSVNLVGPDDSTAQPATGTINYDTGSWTLTLTSPGLLTACDIRANYVYLLEAIQPPTEPEPENPDPNPEDGSNPWDDIFTMRIDQLGNQLTFIDSKNGRYAGVLTGVSNTGGDSSGQTGGQIEALFEVNGNTSDGRPITITGSFTGLYIAPGEDSDTTTGNASSTGFLNNRVVQAMWVEQNDGSTAEMLGQAIAISVELAQENADIVATGTGQGEDLGTAAP